MAEFSKEWCEKEEFNIPYDFSVIEVFSRLKEGESTVMICEGFGFTHIVNDGGECYVVKRGELIRFDQL